MVNANMLEMINIELCKIDDINKQLKHVYDMYISIYKTIERAGIGTLNQKTLEDILITNDEIKRKLVDIISARDGVQDKIIEELKNIKDKNNI